MKGKPSTSVIVLDEIGRFEIRDPHLMNAVAGGSAGPTPPEADVNIQCKGPNLKCANLGCKPY